VSRRLRPSSPKTATAESDALRLLARRPLTRAELRGRLAESGHPVEKIDEACAKLESAGYLDDARLARHYLVTRAARLGHGPVRMLDELERRGVRRPVAEAAWSRAVDERDIVPDELLRSALLRRIPAGGIVDVRTRTRVYNALLRAGFPVDAVAEALAGQANGEVDDDLT
jgi:regulatory protein